MITHPAYFDRAAVEETRQAAIEAGFDMSLTEQMLMEPVAAALAYTRTDRRDPLHVLTYDLGGGTFDVTCLVRRSGLIDMRAFDGDHLMGGYNFDRELVGWVRKCLEGKNRRIVLDETDPEDRARLARLLRLAEEVKIALARHPRTTPRSNSAAAGSSVDVDGKDVQINERISRTEFVALIAPYLHQAIDGCRRALKKAGMEPSELDEVLLVGGSTYGPWVAASLQEALPQPVPKLFYPDLCVGAGAAIHAKMVLPALVGKAGCRLVLDVPEVSVLETINVAGRVTDADGRPFTEPPAVSLRLPGMDSRCGPVSPTADGGFLFEEIALTEDANHPLPADRFRPRRPGPAASTSFRCGTPRKAGRPRRSRPCCRSRFSSRPLTGSCRWRRRASRLPAQCEQTFTRENDNPSISLKLFQEHHAVGEVRIENIPPEGGRGSLVHLKVQVTEKNEICGTATVRTREGRVVLQSPVRITFDVPEVPSADRLWDEFSRLQAKCIELLSTSGDGRDERRTAVLELLDKAHRLFDQQPLERQEVAVALRRVRDLLEVPKDDMRPTRQEFCKVVADCRKRIRQVQQRARAAIGQTGTDAVGIDRSLIGQVLRIGQRAAKLAPILDRLERQALEAHERRDRRTWGRTADAVTDLTHQLDDRAEHGETGLQPTVVSKAMAMMTLRRLQDQLDRQLRKFEEEGRLDDWRNEFDRIQTGLNETFAEIAATDDGLPPEQGLAAIRRIYQRRMQPLEEAIKRLGVDVSKVG